MKHAASCIFCKIVRGAAPAVVVCEDELSLAFMDIAPVAEGHTLVIPREHSENLFEVSEAELAAVAATSRRVAHAIRAALSPDGLGVFQLNGQAAGQTVFHYHMHLIPRSDGQTLQIHGRRRGDPEMLRRVAEAIARELPGPSAQSVSSTTTGTERV